MLLLASPWNLAPTKYAAAVSSEYTTWTGPCQERIEGAREKEGLAHPRQQHKVVIYLKIADARRRRSSICPQGNENQADGEQCKGFGDEVTHLDRRSEWSIVGGEGTTGGESRRVI